MKEPSASQLRVLARAAVDELTYYPGGSAWFPRGQQVNRASVAALLRSGYLEPDPDDLTTLRVTAAGRDVLAAHPEAARAAEQDADVRAVLRQWQAGLADARQGGPADRASRAEAAALIARYLANPKSVTLRPLPEVPPGAPI